MSEYEFIVPETDQSLLDEVCVNLHCYGHSDLADGLRDLVSRLCLLRTGDPELSMCTLHNHEAVAVTLGTGARRRRYEVRVRGN